MNQEKLYDMKLHEVFKVYQSCGDSITAMRVPGGWIYASCFNDRLTETFVPFNNEFMKTDKLKPLSPSKSY